MSQGKSIPVNSFFQELVQTGIYKRTQGRVTRQVTFAVMAVTFGLAAWRLQQTLSISSWLAGYHSLQYVIPGMLIALGCWGSFRVVNLPRFADFLIAVEAEMNKVSWPSKGELYRSSMVVIFVIFALAMVLFGYDIIWRTLFQWLGILHE
jgi:preprotein translocase subunit SecE